MKSAAITLRWHFLLPTEFPSHFCSCDTISDSGPTNLTVVCCSFLDVGVDVAQPHISLADILEDNLKSSSWAGPFTQLPVQDDF